jgi:pSer/pThr/pTyr-binding forkhead associated (FHA) protein
LIVDADRAHFDRVRPHGISFPVAFAPRVFELCGDVVVVGRGDGRGPGPDIDLGGEPEDVAVSRRHVLLERAPDGSYTLLDPGSTNGTLVNEADQPLPLGRRIALKDRDRLFIGAWTRIMVRTG